MALMLTVVANPETELREALAEGISLAARLSIVVHLTWQHRTFVLHERDTVDTHDARGRSQHP